MSELDVIGVLHGTDKSSARSLSWDYLRHYEELLQRWKASPINVIEIGVAAGGSVDTWLGFFEKATLVGIDVNPACLRFARDRVVIKIGSQEDPSFLHSVAAEYKPTIVIDDGSHIAHHIITSFEALFPQLLPGGIYIIEDLSFHFEDGVSTEQGHKKHQGLSDIPIYEYFSRFMRARAASVALPKDAWGFSRYAFEQIDSVTVLGGAIAIRKRGARNYEEDVRIFEREIRKMPNSAVGAERFAHFLVKHNVYHDRAVALLQEVLSATPDNRVALFDWFTTMNRLRRFDEAAEAANELARLDPAVKPSWQRVVQAQGRRERPDHKVELAALRRLAEFPPVSRDTYDRISVLCEQFGDMLAALTAARKASEIEPGNAHAAKRVRDLEAKRS